MIHSINELCTKINGLKIKADKLQTDNKAKEDGCSIPKAELDHQIADIQLICNLIANDKSY
jgi:hypothetical protein